MRVIAVIAVILSSLGCRSVVGPFRRDRDPERVTDPLISIPEQQRANRAKYATPTEDLNLPRTYSDRYGPTGR